jgi:hypothetical protein
LQIEYSSGLGCGLPPALPLWEEQACVNLPRCLSRTAKRKLQVLPSFPQVALAVLFIPFISAAQSTIGGVIHDPQHRPVQGAQISVRNAPQTQPTLSDAQGTFQLAIPGDGAYVITATAPGFAAAEQNIQVIGGKSPVIHIELPLAAVAEAVTVSEAPDRLNAQSATPQTLVAEKEIAQTAGADQTNSLSMITDFTPGAYKRPIRRRLSGLPRFVVTRGGEYCFLPGLRALKWLGELPTQDYLACLRSSDLVPCRALF